MKQKFIPKQTQKQKLNVHHGVQTSLNILSMNNEALKIYLNEQLASLPYLSFANIEQDDDSFLNYAQKDENLYEVLHSQIPYCKTRLNSDLCDYLIFQLDSNGYFRVNEDELLSNSPFSTTLTKQHIHYLQQFEPLGCFAFSLAHCLKLQCVEDSQICRDAYLLCDYLEEVVKGKLDYFEERTKLSKERKRKAFSYIQSLNPKPAANYSCFATFAQPEFKIFVNDNKITIELEQDEFELVFDAEIAEESEEIQTFLRQQRKASNRLINDIKNRNTTLLQIMQIICDYQKNFFLKNEPLKHLTLEMIAKKAGIHTSTVSRAIANKTFEFNHHYYPLKKMLNHGGTSSSEDIIKQRILYHIKNEDLHHPYSDEQLRKLLLNENIEVARRTIGKYRESMNILSTTYRRAR